MATNKPQKKLTESEKEAKVFETLSSKRWRLNNLYHILDKQGKKIKFEMNEHQAKLFDNLHCNNIILKARQLGFTTFICLWMLDECLFRRNIRAGIIAHTLDDASSIFRDKIRFAYENLPAEIKAAIPLVGDSKTELSLANGSILRVGTSLRGGTLQILLITEFGKICARMPERAREIITGSLNTLQAGQTCFIESTAEGQSGAFYEMCQAAQAMQRRGQQLGLQDYKFHFFPWHCAKEYQQAEYSPIHEDDRDYFHKLQNEGIELTEAQKFWYVKKKDILNDDIKREFPSTPEEAFEQSLEGAYYTKQLHDIEAKKQIGTVSHDPSLPVSTYWDLGMNDSTAIVFVQKYRNENRIIDYYECSGEGLPHYVSVLRQRGYIYNKHFAPHDIRVRELGTGRSRYETAASLGIMFEITPNIPVIDGINAVRQVFPLCWFDEQKTGRLLQCLRNYRKEWDDKNGRWKDNPVHDEFEHGASAFRYFAVNNFISPQINDINNLQNNVQGGFKSFPVQQRAEGISLTW